MIPEATNQEKVDQILFGEGSLHELKPFFPNQEAIFSYYAKRMAELFSPNKDANECACCHLRSVELKVVLEWRGTYHTTRTAIISTVGIALAVMAHHLFRFLIPSKQIDFSTTHGLCSNCYQQIGQRRMFASLVKQLCLVSIVIAVMIFVSVIVFVILFLLPQPTGNAIAYAAIGFFSGFFFLVGGLLGADWIICWCLPKSLRFISKPPFQLVGFHKL